MSSDAIAALVVPSAFVLMVALLFPATRRALASWIHRRAALSDEAYTELVQMRRDIALLRNEVAELRSLLPGVGESGRIGRG